MQYFLISLRVLLFFNNTAVQEGTAKVPLYHVYEVSFSGPSFKSIDNPVAEVDLITLWRYESGSPVYEIYGYWDGDGKGGISGNVFKVRFCPTKTGNWTLVRTTSNKIELNGQKEGLMIDCIPSSHKGFWEVDQESNGSRWFKRSDGSHSYIIGNTMYSFLSEYKDDKATGGNIATDVNLNAAYFKKLRFAITGDIYPNPAEKPFLDNAGNPTDDGNFSHRPNPKWFHKRIDLAVKVAYDQDLIADIILNGPDSKDARSVLLASENAGDNTPFLKYIAARYGSFPNVWICLSNEFDIRKPRYEPEEIKIFGYRLKSFLPYSTPLSVHPCQRDWYPELNVIRPWNTHTIFQYKLKSLCSAADYLERNYWIGGGNKPVIDDELAYEGIGDGWIEDDVIEAHLGAFLGGGYGSTGQKSGNKKGQYFSGKFNALEHTAVDNLLWLRQKIDENISFWKMEPALRKGPSIFSQGSHGFRAMEWRDNEYVLGTNKAWDSITARLPAGK